MRGTVLDRRRFLRTAAVATCVVCLGTTGAAAAVWERLGVRTVLLAGDVDVIPVTAAEGLFRAVQLRVRQNGIFINDMQITFGNGNQMDVPLRHHIPKGGKTRVIDLPGARRNIRSVRIVYRSEMDLGGRATVELWGRR